MGIFHSLKGKSLLNVILLLASLIFLSKGYNFIYWNATNLRYLTYLTYIIFVVTFFFYVNDIRKYCKLSYYIPLVFIPLISIFAKFLFTNEGVDLDNLSLMLAFGGCSFVLLQKRDMKESEIILAIVIYGLITVFLQIIQQNMSDFPLFGIDPEKYDVDALTRNGVVRYSLGLPIIGEFCLFYFWASLCQKFKFWKFVLFVIFVISIYMYMTRQLLIAVLITLIISLFIFRDKRITFVAVSVLLISSLYVYNNFDSLFGELIEFSRDNTHSADARTGAYPRFFSESFSDPIRLLFGHGYDKEHLKWGPRYDSYPSDIGFVGELYLHGLIWVSLYFVFLYKFYKSWKNLPAYLSLFVICTFLHSIMIFPYRYGVEILMWMCVLHIFRMKLRESNENINSNGLL